LGRRNPVWDAQVEVKRRHSHVKELEGLTGPPGLSDKSVLTPYCAGAKGLEQARREQARGLHRGKRLRRIHVQRDQPTIARHDPDCGTRELAAPPTLDLVTTIGAAIETVLD